MNCLFTVNIGDFITPLVHRRFRAACCRWKCDYAELTHNALKGYPSTAKWFGADKLRGFDKLMFVDGDCLIGENAPNPFEICQCPNVLYAVTDLQAGNPNSLWRESVYRKPLASILSKHPELKIHPEEKAFNAGVMLFMPTPEMRLLFERARNIFPDEWTGYQEQSTLNMLLHNTPELCLELIPLAWNHMVIRENEDLSPYYINHFGGSAHEFLKRKSSRVS